MTTFRTRPQPLERNFEPIMTEIEIERMVLALSWARTFLDDPGEALSREETIACIDDALATWYKANNMATDE